MSEWRYFVNKEGASNKYWQFRYVDSGMSVEKKWGRIGGNESAQTKTFGSRYKADSYIEGEVRKKTRKGYVEQNQEALAEETDVAQTIGTRWKIGKVEFLAQAWDANDKGITNLRLGDTYLPACGVYVELLESWSKERRFMIINKDNALAFRTGMAASGEVHLSGYSWPAHQFVSGVRKMVQNVYKAVEEVVVRFGAVGVRVLELDDIESAPPEAQEARTAFRAAAKKTGLSDQVIQKFAAVGVRQLEI